jgi:class 3 adenylate cyclase
MQNGCGVGQSIWGVDMPLYMDIHEIDGATADDLAIAHAADVHVQDQYGVEYHKYWFNEQTGKVFCICSAPNPEAAAAVHKHAHGQMASKIIEVDPDMADGFLGGCAVNPAGAALIPETKAGDYDAGIRTIMFTDIVGSTAMTQRLGDDAAMAMVNSHDRIVRGALHDLRGREIKHTGDGIMACFVSAASAVRCAIRIQREMRAYCEANPDMPVQLRIGLAAGEPVEQNQDLFGSTVQLAARLCASAEPEQSLASNVLAELCIGKGLRFDDRGEYSLKGFAHPVRVHAIGID